MDIRNECEGVWSFDLISKEDCAAIVEQMNTANAWAFATGDNTRLLTVSQIADAGLSLECFEPLEKAIEQCLKPSAPERIANDIVCHWGMTLRRYAPGQALIPHRDVSENRLYSMVCYLNDNYLGGQTYFHERNCMIGPKAGKAILFEARLLHSGLKVHTGEKYVLFAAFGKALPQNVSGAYE